MPELDQLFSAVDGYKNMTQKHFSDSKIGKVMRPIYKRPPEKVPPDDEFRLRERARALVAQWHDLLSTPLGIENRIGGCSGDLAVTDQHSDVSAAHDEPGTGTVVVVKSLLYIIRAPRAVTATQFCW